MPRPRSGDVAARPGHRRHGAGHGQVSTRSFLPAASCSIYVLSCLLLRLAARSSCCLLLPLCLFLSALSPLSSVSCLSILMPVEAVAVFSLRRDLPIVGWFGSLDVVDFRSVTSGYLMFPQTLERFPGNKTAD